LFLQFNKVVSFDVKKTNLWNTVPCKPRAVSTSSSLLVAKKGSRGIHVDPLRSTNKLIQGENFESRPTNSGHQGQPSRRGIYEHDALPASAIAKLQTCMKLT
jgi:hypothetical protein